MTPAALEAITDTEKLPARPASELYYGVVTDEGDIPVEHLPKVKQLMETDSQGRRPFYLPFLLNSSGEFVHYNKVG